MSLSFACAMGHAPGITAWAEAAPAGQRDRLYQALRALRDRLAAARLDALILFTAEHWANFFLDHMSAFCIGAAEHYRGPIEPWLRIDRTLIQGDKALASALLEACYAHDLEPGFAHEMQLDHGTMVPLHFLTPDMSLPIVPIVINTLAAPYPSAPRCLALGRVIGEVARAAPQRIGIVATGGMSHDPGERNHGVIDSSFDQRFLQQMSAGELGALSQYSSRDLLGAGAGAVELLTWIALGGALQSFRGQVLAYEAVKPWATGIGVMEFQTD
ncbi:MAG: extradiol ring-cleavage dioxygenase [Steroidobacteraceae bacterium]